MAVSQTVTIGCLPDRIPLGTVTSGADASAKLAAANVQNYDLGTPWRCGYFSARHSWLQAQWSGTLSPEIEAAAFVANLPPGGLYRVQVSTGNINSTWQTLAPTSVVSSSNATANDGVSAVALSEINEDCDTALSSPNGGARLKSNTGLGSSLRLGFNTPGFAPKLGAAVQELRFVAKLQGSGITGAMNIRVYDSGSATVVASLHILAEDFTTDVQEFVLHWDASDLVSTNGSNVEFQFSTGFVSGGVDTLIEAVEWNCYNVGLLSADYDSGIQPAYDTYASAQFGDASIADGFNGVNWLAGAPFGSSVTGVTTLLVEIWNFDVSQRRHSEVPTTGYWDSSWLPVEVSTLMAGPIYVPTQGMMYGWSLGIKDYSKVSQNLVGSTFVRSTFKKRQIGFTLAHLSHEEAMQNLLLWLGLYAGRGVPFALFPEATRDGVQTIQNGLFRLTSDVSLKNIRMSGARGQVTIQAEEW